MVAGNNNAAVATSFHLRNDGRSTLPYRPDGVGSGTTTTLDGKYLLGRGLLGLGTFARVYPATNTATNAVVVLKIQDVDRHVAELHALLRLRDVMGVVTLLDCFSVEKTPCRCVLVLPKLEAVDYAAVAHADDRIAEFADSAASILRSVHALDVAHGDIKPAAFMVDCCGGACVSKGRSFCSVGSN